MFERGGMTAEDLRGLLPLLGALGTATDDGERVDRLDVLERIKSACAAAQARETVELAESQAQVAEEWREHARSAAAAGDFEAWRAARDRANAASCPEADDAGDVPDGERRRGRRRPTTEMGVAAQVALARRESPHAGGRLVRLASALTSEMPYLLALLERGVVSERRAALVVQETAVLSLDLRQRVDTELHHLLGDELGRLSDRELTSRVRAITYRLDAQSVVDRAAHAENERRVSLRPAPDTMCWLTALLPATHGVAVLAALTRAAESARLAGDTRGRGQVMADVLVERTTGQAEADQVPVEVQLVITDRALLSGDDTPASIPGYGVIPAAWSRRLVQRAGDRQEMWLRRLFTHPVDGSLVAMDSRRRTFDGPLRRYLVARDGSTCRTPGCGAPIRHLDHVRAHAHGGPTSVGNGQGLCARCNLVKELTGWFARVVESESAHTVVITTPTGHGYSSNAPPVVTEDPGVSNSPLERALEHVLAA